MFPKNTSFDGAIVLVLNCAIENDLRHNFWWRIIVTSIKNPSTARPSGVWSASPRVRSFRLLTMCICVSQPFNSPHVLCYQETATAADLLSPLSDICVNPWCALSRLSRWNPNGNETARWRRRVPNRHLRSPRCSPSECTSLETMREAEDTYLKSSSFKIKKQLFVLSCHEYRCESYVNLN